MAKARHVIGDQNSAEFDALRRSFNSLLLVLEQLATEVDASTITTTQVWTVLKAAINSGVDSSAAGGVSAHVGTGRQPVGVSPSPLHPARAAEESIKLVPMAAADKF